MIHCCLPTGVQGMAVFSPNSSPIMSLQLESSTILTPLQQMVSSPQMSTKVGFNFFYIKF